MSSLIIKRCCCICDSYPTSIVINVPAYTSGGMSFAAFTQTLYKCCIQRQRYPQYWYLKQCCVYKMNPVVCGMTTNMTPNLPIYFTMTIKFGNPPYPYFYDELTFNISFGYLNENPLVLPCVPRSDSTSQTACYGLTVFSCSNYTYDLQGYRNSFFEDINSSSCGCLWNGSSYLETQRWVGNCGQVAGTYILDYVTPDLTVTIS